MSKENILVTSVSDHKADVVCRCEVNCFNDVLGTRDVHSVIDVVTECTGS